MSPQTEFGLGDVINCAAICFPSHWSVSAEMYFIASFEYGVAFPVTGRSSIATESELFALSGRVFVRIFGQIVSIRVTTLLNTNEVASRLIKRKKALLPVVVRLVCMWQRKRHAFRPM